MDRATIPSISDAERGGTVQVINQDRSERETWKMFVNLTNHPSASWSEDQLHAARQWGPIQDYPFPAVDPSADRDTVVQMAEIIAEDVLIMNPACVCCQGEMTLTYHLVNQLKERGILCVAACSERRTQETIRPDGSTEKLQVFDFIGFRAY